MDWAERQLARECAAAESNERSNEIRIRDDRIKDKHGADLFRQLRQYLGKQVEKYNAGKQKKVIEIEDYSQIATGIGSTERRPDFSIKRMDKMSELFVSYSACTHTIEYEFIGSTGRWILGLDEENSPFFRKPNEAPVGIEQVGNELLSMVSGAKYRPDSKSP